MTFLQRQRTRSHKKSNNTIIAVINKDKRLPDLPIGVENIPQTVRSTKSVDGKQHGLLKRVGSIFTPRKRPNLDLQLVYSALHHNTTRQSYDDSPTSCREYEAEIRCPSGLGSAASIISKRSLPPSPFCPQNGSPYTPVVGSQHLIKRAISSPNLLRSLSQKVRGKTRPRGASSIMGSKATTTTNSGVLPQSAPHDAAPRRGPRFPEEVISLIISSFPRSAVASCATTSRMFVSPSRASLYGTVDTSPLTVTQLEKLISTLSTHKHLAELVTTFICPEWPPFFTSDTRDRSARHKDALLMATFALAIERMSNLTSLTLPAFDMSLIAHQTSFGLKSVTFLSYTMTNSETRALFAWLDGQVNISTLRFPNLLDLNARTDCSHANNMDDENSRPRTAPDTLYLKPFPTSNRSSSLSPYSTPLPSPTRLGSPPFSQANSLFSSSTLLPNLTTLHATPTLVRSLAAPLADIPFSRRPLQSVWLNINTTLYSGLRPASLMSSLCGISHLGLTFSPNVDRRSFEKIIGAAGASLGSVRRGDDDDDDDDDPFIVDPNPPLSKSGLRILEIVFQTLATQLGRDEVCRSF